MGSLHGTIAAIVPELIELRHELHKRPELRFEEQWTSERIASFLAQAGVPFETGYAKGTGIVAHIHGSGGKTVALRADMDALEIDEATGRSYASAIPHQMHACGHDGHMACLCGAAKPLSLNRRLLRGDVKFIFQPAEEQAGGGRLMVDEGVLEGVHAVFAFHGWPGLALGKIGVKDGPMMANANFFRATIQGKGCHGADPGAGIDPVVAAAYITAALQTIVSREIDPWDPCVVTVGRIVAGSTTNIIPESAQIEGTFRTLSTETHRKVKGAVERVITGTARTFRAEASVEFGEDPYPALVNDPAMTDCVRETAVELWGVASVVEIAQPYMASEDFAYYLERVPGSFIWLGLNDGGADAYPALHSSRFDFNDRAIPLAVELLSTLALRVLARP